MSINTWKQKSSSHLQSASCLQFLSLFKQTISWCRRIVQKLLQWTKQTNVDVQSVRIQSFAVQFEDATSRMVRWNSLHLFSIYSKCILFFFYLFKNKTHEKLFTSDRKIAIRSKECSKRISLWKQRTACNTTLSHTVRKNWKTSSTWKRAVQRIFISSKIITWQKLSQQERFQASFETKCLIKLNKEHCHQ